MYRCACAKIELTQQCNITVPDQEVEDGTVEVIWAVGSGLYTVAPTVDISQVYVYCHRTKP